MTAEIAVLNKLAIALAADSAVTVGEKVFNSANKLFALSKFKPVGVMIYGAADFMGIPWESLIKIYRENLKDKKFDTLKEYAEDWINFISECKLFDLDEQNAYVQSTIFNHFSIMVDVVKKAAKDRINSHGHITDPQTRKLVKSLVDFVLDNLNENDKIPHFPNEFDRVFTRKHKKDIEEIIRITFSRLPLSKSTQSKLLKIASLIFSRNVFKDQISGVVIAGFGEKEIFPSVYGYDFEGVVDDIVKYNKNESKCTTITIDNTASIVAFAQSEMVYTFMQGVDPGLSKFSEEYLDEVFSDYSELLIDKLKELRVAEKKHLTEILKNDSKSLLDRYKKAMETYQQDSHVSGIMEMVAVLPKDELASVAEALVNLTSVKRKVSAVTETVGGPIDVAIISKGDGFVWIKRKHYFPANLNHQFFANNYSVGGHYGS